MKKVIVLLFYSSIISGLLAQDSLTTKIVAQFTYPLKENDNHLTGQGWDSLKRDISGSQFVLLGENHSSPRLSELTAILLKEMKLYGFAHFIIETGPLASEKIKQLHHKDLPVFTKNLHDFLSRYKLEPGSPPAEFLAMKTDPVMYSSAFQNGYTVKGIDKEYMASYHYLFDELRRYCTNTMQMDLYQAALQRLLSYNADLIKDDNFTLTIHCQNDTLIQRFLTVMVTNPKAKRIVIEIRKSWEIYGLYESKLYAESESVRIALLKRNFGNYYYSHQQRPFKALIKYGNVHTQRGDSYLGYPDLGNLMSELAAMNGTRSLHIQNMRRYRYDNRDSIMDFAEKGYEIYPHFISLANKEQWMLIDLQPIRKLLLAGKIKATKDERSLIIKNDWIMLTPVDGAYTKSFNYE